MKPRSVHLGDGAYATIHYGNDDAPHEIVFTANHHDPQQASDTVFVDHFGIKCLTQFLERPELGQEVDE